ncbi:ROK family protein [Rhodococcus sp. IEGM 1401]|uniref:ROK family protein n=1 Tax=unclassified Rhodococcus (in: high G+C Gram-positive bacteria) TaxID=192944 RepID=UPI0022B3EFC3|nr:MULTISPECIES: ROK family protein [unclassified Rhodococcus (in: high G+C Gram-positive bacteria)]MCZ4560797.1 ROK family protein [Rhodococcus sp. IEGM 1401]MDI9920937.1 ROK family protein [Rhodococcus sp. IEGM 1372]MDV8033462.1 ROK family protein [Rhodococcus sp. IEGM 1414]
MTALALDIGGTKMTAALVGDDGRPENPVTVPTPESDVWDACAALLRNTAEPASVTRIGVACSGPVDLETGSVAPINVDEWKNGFGLRDHLAEVFPEADIRLAMDGSAAALGEHRFGSAVGVPDVLSLVVSTGIGGGLVLGGQIVAGASGNAGHIGHIVVPGSTTPCACGGIGCVETVSSGPSAVRWARELGWTGSTGTELAADAAAGEPVAITSLQRAGVALGQAIASAVALVDVRMVVIGGGFAQAGPPLWNPIQESIALHARLKFLDGLQVVPAALGGLGTLAGAAALTV